MLSDLNNIEVTLLNAIRRNPNHTKSEVASSLNISWSTVSTTIHNLVDRGMVIVNENPSSPNKTQKSLYRATVSINNNFAHYVGISVGSSNLKLVFLGFDFEYLKKDTVLNDLAIKSSFYDVLNKYNFNVEDERSECRWCADTPKDSIQLCNALADICSCICDLKDKNILNVTAITLTFPGHIDFENQKIISTANLCTNDIKQANITRFITSTVLKRLEDCGVDVFIDHNVKSSAIAEQEYLYTKNMHHKNLIVLYLGKGIGIGMILNDRLYRGNSNSAGQLGHITLSPGNKELEYIIRNEIFSKEGIVNFFEISAAEELKNFILENEDKKQQLVNILALTLKNVLQILGIEDIVFSGKFDRILEAIEMDLIAKLEDINFPGLGLHHSYYGEYSAAVGAAISCFNNKYQIPFEW